MFYRPVPFGGRHFSKIIEYAAIDFTKLASVVLAFKARLTDWYITPGICLAGEQKAGTTYFRYAH